MSEPSMPSETAEGPSPRALSPGAIAVLLAATLAVGGLGVAYKVYVYDLTEVVGGTPAVMMCAGCDCRSKHVYKQIHGALTCALAGGHWQSVAYSGPVDEIEHRFYCLTPTQDPCTDPPGSTR